SSPAGPRIDPGNRAGAVNLLLRDGPLSMAADDRRLCAELMAEGSLGDGYHPRMQEVHRCNAARLKEVIGEHGWRGRGLVGEDGAHAAWLVLQPAIGEPELQRRGLVAHHGRACCMPSTSACRRQCPSPPPPGKPAAATWPLVLLEKEG